MQSKFTLLKSKFFPTKFFFCILEKGILAAKNLLFKRVNLLCKGGFSIIIRAGSSQNFTVFISLLAPFPFAFGALFTVSAPSASVFLKHVEAASSRPCLSFTYYVTLKGGRGGRFELALRTILSKWGFVWFCVMKGEGGF